MARNSYVHGYVSGRDVKNRFASGKPVIAMDEANVADYADLQRVGLGFTKNYLRDASAIYAMDDAQGGVLTPNGGLPVQFLQTFLPGLVQAAFAPTLADKVFGFTTVGNWYDEEVVQGVLEGMGDAIPYGDLQNIPLSDYNVNYERRTVVRFEKGLQVGRLEEARNGAAGINSMNEKRNAAQRSLNINANLIAFNGYRSGDNRTYGALNDPNLPAYVTVAANSSSATLWSKKSYLDIISDLIAAFTALQTQSNGAVDAINSPTCLVLPTNVSTYLSTVSNQGGISGGSVLDWLKNTYPNCRVESVPQFAGANGGANVFYLFAERIEDGSTDGGRVFEQLLPARGQLLGVEQRAKAIIEDYTNATAGLMCKRPWAVVRFTGI